MSVNGGIFSGENLGSQPGVFGRGVSWCSVVMEGEGAGGGSGVHGPVVTFSLLHVPLAHCSTKTQPFSLNRLSVRK